MGEGRQSARRMEAIEKQRQALELRMAGATHAEIARQLGYAGPSGAVKAIDSAIMRTLQEPADKVRKIELTRLDRIMLAIWPRALQGDDKAIRRVLDIMERRARYLGLDAPTKIDLGEFVREQARSAGLNDEDTQAAVRFAEEHVRGGA